jgi:thioredoxin 1
MMVTNKVAIALVLIAVFTAVLVAGVALAHSAWTPTSAQGTVQQYTMADIDNALAKCPVFVEFEAGGCDCCKRQRPISEALAGDYSGKVTFMFIDAVYNCALANRFQVSYMPQMDVLLSKTATGYTYVDRNGKTSDNIAASRFQGLTNKDTLQKALDAAVQLRGQ